VRIVCESSEFSTLSEIRVVGAQFEIENHTAMVSLYFLHSNFGRVHRTLHVTPAMEGGIADHVWSIEEIVSLLG